ncbi:hypothetical protein DRN86_02400 [Candidatus Geothermarchaeota archaeon]|nr:MAG: hypothetical protein DRN86_02400 [Candidatus Geothermarchaeota archaeon]
MLALETAGILVSIAAALSWSVAALFYKKGELGLSSFESNALRCILPLFSLTLMEVYFHGLSFLNINLANVLSILFATLLTLVIGDSLYLLSIRYLGVSLAVSTSYTFPVFTSILAFLFLGEFLPQTAYIGVLLTVCGIWLLNYKGEKGVRKSKIGFLTALLTSLCWAAGITAFRHILFDMNPLDLTTWRMIILTLILSPFLVKAIRKASFKNAIYLNLGGFFGLMLGGIFLHYGLDWIGAARTSTISSITPLFSTILAVVILKEKIRLWQWLGIASITLGLMLVTAF